MYASSLSGAPESTVLRIFIPSLQVPSATQERLRAKCLNDLRCSISVSAQDHDIIVAYAKVLPYSPTLLFLFFVDLLLNTICHVPCSFHSFFHFTSVLLLDHYRYPVLRDTAGNSLRSPYTETSWHNMHTSCPPPSFPHPQSCSYKQAQDVHGAMMDPATRRALITQSVQVSTWSTSDAS